MNLAISRLFKKSMVLIMEKIKFLSNKIFDYLINAILKLLKSMHRHVR